MKNLVLTRKQLNEVVTTLNVGFDGNGVDSQEVQNAVNIGKRSGDYNIKVSNKTQTGPKNDNDLPVVSFDVQGDPNASEMMGLIDKQPGVKNSLTNGEAAVQFNTTQEGLQYTKKQIEEMRVNNIKKNGSVMTKQQLQEEFDNNSKFFLCDIDDPDNLQPINPIYVLRPEDIDEEEGIVYMNGVEINYISENTNFYEDENGSDFCQPGDLVFEFNNEYAFYRKGLNECTGFVNYNAVVGTTQEVHSFIASYQ